jgi:hypothetical protein
MAADGILRGEGKVMNSAKYECTLVHTILYLETEFKRRVK